MIQMLLNFFNLINQYLIAIYRDLLGIRLFIDIKSTLKKFQNEQSNTFSEFQKLVKKHPKKACIIFDDKIWTFKDVLSRNNI